MIHLRHLETTITVACQNRCVACNAFVPLQEAQFRESMVTPEDLGRDLAELARVAHVDRYALIGGEPTLHPELRELLRVSKASGIADQIEVWTNGQGILDRGVWGLTDRLVVSAYPGKITDVEIDKIRVFCELTGIEFELKDERRRPNWMRLLEAEPTGPLDTQRKYDRCWNRTKCHVLDRGHFYRCCTSPFIPRLLQGRPDGSDGLPVAGVTEKALRAFLAEPEAMESCRVCAGFSSGRKREHPIEWREVSTPAEWIRASAGERV